MIIGTKTDLLLHREVSISDAEAFASKFQMFFMEVSNSDRTNIDLTYRIISIRVANRGNMLHAAAKTVSLQPNIVSFSPVQVTTTPTRLGPEQGSSKPRTISAPLPLLEESETSEDTDGNARPVSAKLRDTVSDETNSGDISIEKIKLPPPVARVESPPLKATPSSTKKKKVPTSNSPTRGYAQIASKNVNNNTNSSSPLKSTSVLAAKSKPQPDTNKSAPQRIVEEAPLPTPEKQQAEIPTPSLEITSSGAPEAAVSQPLPPQQQSPAKNGSSKSQEHLMKELHSMGEDLKFLVRSYKSSMLSGNNVPDSAPIVASSSNNTNTTTANIDSISPITKPAAAIPNNSNNNISSSNTSPSEQHQQQQPPTRKVGKNVMHIMSKVPSPAISKANSETNSPMLTPRLAPSTEAPGMAVPEKIEINLMDIVPQETQQQQPKRHTSELLQQAQQQQPLQQQKQLQEELLQPVSNGSNSYNNNSNNIVQLDDSPSKDSNDDRDVIISIPVLENEIPTSFEDRALSPIRVKSLPNHALQQQQQANNRNMSLSPRSRRTEALIHHSYIKNFHETKEGYVIPVIETHLVPPSSNTLSLGSTFDSKNLEEVTKTVPFVFKHVGASDKLRQPKIFVDINLGDGRIGQVGVCSGDNVFHLAEQFVKSFHLDVSYVKYLAYLIKSAIAKYIQKQRQLKQQRSK